MPGWYASVKKWVDEGKLAVVGVAQEQQADRCRLYAAWQEFDFPILYDPINLLGQRGVPIVLAIDEHGVIRSVRPKVKTFEKDFLSKTYPPPKAPPAGKEAPEGKPMSRPAGEDKGEKKAKAKPDFKAIKRQAEAKKSAPAWRAYGDALVIHRGLAGVEDAIEAYSKASQLDAKDGVSLFRLGVCYRMRYESKARREGDDENAMAHWKRAVALDKGQYIWRRRVQQYSSPKDRPYTFYNWMDKAKKEIEARGDKPPTVSGSGADDYAKPAKP